MLESVFLSVNPLLDRRFAPIDAHPSTVVCTSYLSTAIILGNSFLPMAPKPLTCSNLLVKVACLFYTGAKKHTNNSNF